MRRITDITSKEHFVMASSSLPVEYSSCLILRFATYINIFNYLEEYFVTQIFYTFLLRIIYKKILSSNIFIPCKFR